jgi:gamma-glutamyltranspeptidase/glutathione hydrolase
MAEIEQIPQVQPRALARGRNGCVACANPAASRAGLACLEAGGNAFDALTCMSWALTVAEPTMSGLFGLSTILVRTADGEHRWLDAGGVVPAALDRARLEEGRAQKSPTIEALVPTLVPANARLLDDLGTWALTDTLEPAIALAREGVDTTDTMRYWFTVAQSESDRPLPPLYRPASLTIGQRFQQPLVDKTLCALAQMGARNFMVAEPAQALVTAAREAGGVIDMEDLGACDPQWSDCIQTTYRDRTLFGPGSPNCTFEIFHALGLLEQFDLGASEAGSVEHYHLLAEAITRAAARRIRHYAEPVSPTDDFTRLMSNAEGDPLSPSSVTHTDGLQWSPAESDPVRGSGNTTHLAAIDGMGNAACATQTYGGLFGSNVWADAWGVSLNSIGKFELAHQPDAPRGLQPASRQPAYSLLEMVIAERQGKLDFTMGSPGSFNITGAILHGIVAMIDFGMDPQAAADLPRCTPVKGTSLDCEDRIDPQVLDALRCLGHRPRAIGDWSWRMGGLHPVGIDRRSEDRLGGADPRRGGIALAL